MIVLLIGQLGALLAQCILKQVQDDGYLRSHHKAFRRRTSTLA